MMASSNKETEQLKHKLPSNYRLTVSDPRHPWADPVIPAEENPLDFHPSYYLDVPMKVKNGSMMRVKINEDAYEEVHGFINDVIDDDDPIAPSKHVFRLFEETLESFKQIIKHGATSQIFYYRMNSLLAADLAERAEELGYKAEVYQSIDRDPEDESSTDNCLYIVIYKVTKDKDKK